MLKLCFIGGSGHYDYVLRGLIAEVAVVAYAPGSQAEDLSRIAARFASLALSPRQYTDWRAMLDAESPDIAVVNCHFGDHAVANIECLQRGIHTYSEKPIATTLDDLDRVAAAYQKSTAYFAAMFGIRNKAWFQTAKAAIAEGLIGDVRLLNAQKSYRLGQRADFYTRRSSYGGTIPWVGSHALDWIRWFSGREFVSVAAAHSLVGNGGLGDLEATALCQLVLTDGVLASASIDYLRPAKAPSHDDDRIRVVGTAGILEVRGGRVYCLADGEQELPLLPETQPFSDFLTGIAAQDPQGAGDALAITRACLLARQAADEGRLISFK